MNQEQLIKLREKINLQKEELKNNEMLLSFYEKQNFIINYFDIDCLLNLSINYNYSKKSLDIMFIVGEVKGSRKVIDGEELLRFGIESNYPSVINVETKTFAFKNNDVGHKNFINSLLKDRAKEFEVLMLNECIVPSSVKNKVKNLKI